MVIKNAFIKVFEWKLLEILINSNIIKQDGINLCYAYKYLHYYLIAKEYQICSRAALQNARLLNQ